MGRWKLGPALATTLEWGPGCLWEPERMLQEQSTAMGAHLLAYLNTDYII